MNLDRQVVQSKIEALDKELHSLYQQAEMLEKKKDFYKQVVSEFFFPKRPAGKRSSPPGEGLPHQIERIFRENPDNIYTTQEILGLMGEYSRGSVSTTLSKLKKKGIVKLAGYRHYTYDGSELLENNILTKKNGK